MNNLSNEHIADEQNVNDLFAAAYAGDNEAYDRLMESVDNVAPAETDGHEETSDEPANSDETPDIPVEDGSDDVSTVDNEHTDDSADDEASAKAELAALKQELHRYKSDAGRVPYLNRRVQELQRQLEDMQRSPAPKPDEDVALPDNLKQKIERMREIDPDTADVMEATYKAAAAEAAKARAAQEALIASQRQREDDEFLQRETQRLLTVFPEAPQVFASQKWKEWKSKLPPNFRALAESSNADEVAEALRNFKVDAERHLGGYDWAPAAKPADDASRVAAARAQRLQSSPNVKKGAARPVNTAVDVEALFAAAYNSNLPSR